MQKVMKCLRSMHGWLLPGPGACNDRAMRTLVTSACAGAVALVFASCAPSSPAGRIDRNPQIFDALPAKQQEEARAGRIARGMSHDAVFIAWGRPSRRVEMMRPDGPVVRWDYMGTQPVYHAHFYGGYGRGRYGPYGPYSRSAFAMGPEFVYVPYHRASVWFINGKVDSWESVR